MPRKTDKNHSVASKAKTLSKKQNTQESARVIKLLSWWDGYDLSDVDSQKWRRLATHLAKKYIEGFQTKRFKRHIWTLSRDFSFFLDYAKLKQEFPRKSDLQICDLLRDKEPWKGRPTSPENLRNRLSKIRKFIKQNRSDD